MSSSATFADLTRHEEFVRKTLRGLLRDESRVDEGLQETWLRVLRRPGAMPREPQSWLAKIARRCAISLWRSEVRRERHERAAVRDEQAETPEASLARLEVRQRVVAAILGLDEPYRTVVLLRHEQDLDVATIAQRLERSPATVRSQLSRAHAILREKLDRDFGGRERWSLLALPLARPAAPTPMAGVGALGAVAAAAVVTAIAVAWQPWVGAGPTAPAAMHPAVDVGQIAAQRPAAVAAAEPAGTRRAPGEIAARQEPRPAGLLERRLQPAILRDRAYYDDYEAATFSFEHGLRDDPDLTITHNDWDVQFEHGNFQVDMVTDDDSAIVDLGALAPRDFGAFRGDLVFAKTAAVVAGHAYFIGTRDDDTELATVVFVTGHAEGDACTFEWYTTDGTNRAQGSLPDPGTGQPWVRQLEALRGQQVRQRTPVLVKPEVRLQLRGGAGGGNARRLHLDGRGHRIDEYRNAPLDPTAPTDPSDPCVAHAEGGDIPEGSEFVITRIDYRGGNPGDSNGNGAFRVVVAGQRVVDVAPSAQPIASTWTGRLAVPAGRERSTFFEIANSSWGEVWLRGEFVASVTAAQRGFGGENRGFFTDVVRPATPSPWLLGVPSARLQVRAGSVGGNPCRIDLRGRKSIYVGSLSREPIDFTTPLGKNDSVGFANGGVLPPRTVFVVTQVRYAGSAVGNGNGHGALRIVIAGTAIVDVTNTAEPIAGEWTGSLEIVPGEEARTYVEVANDSHGDVQVFGHFEHR